MLNKKNEISHQFIKNFTKIILKYNIGNYFYMLIKKIKNI